MEKEIYFSSDEYQLRGLLHLPAEKNPPIVIGSHGLLSTGDSPKQIALAEACTTRGIAYFRYDHRGCGRSTGDLAAATTFNGRCRDLEAAANCIHTLVETGNDIALFGSSFGGAISLAMAGILSPKSIVTVAAPLYSDSIQEPYVNDPENMAVVQKLNREKLFFDIREKIRGLSHVLVFHGDNDRIVPFENALALEKAAAAPKALVRQANGDHQMSDEIHQKAFIQKASDWFETFFNNLPG